MNKKVTISEIIEENSPFFTAFLFFQIVALGLLFRYPKGEEIFFLDQYRHKFLDLFFRFATLLGEAYTFVLAFFFLYVRARPKAVLIPIVGCSCMLITYFSKHYLAHERPLAYFKNLHIFQYLHPIADVELASGRTSFPSGHTLAAFALFSILALLSENKRRNGLLFFALAFSVSMSRIYLIQHFLEDVLLGSIVGTALGLGVYFIFRNQKSSDIRV